MISRLILLMFAFLLGSIPFGRIWSALLGQKDLRRHGSGNIGATNAFRVNGKLVGSLTMLCDIAKGFACVFFADPILFGTWIVIGQMYAPWSRGKGIASFFGMCLAILHYYALIPMIVWAILVVGLRVRPTHSSYAALLLMCIISFVIIKSVFMLIVLISIMIVYRHVMADFAHDKRRMLQTK